MTFDLTNFILTTVCYMISFLWEVYLMDCLPQAYIVPEALFLAFLCVCVNSYYVEGRILIVHIHEMLCHVSYEL